MPSFIPLPLLAFGFTSAWLLWGLALGGLPVVIHLLYKRRYRESPWAAMRFLLEAARKNSRRIRLEQLVLLMVRILIFVLLVTALAEPTVETFGVSLPAEAATHHIVIVDASFSMGHRSAERSHFERAKAVAKELLGGANQGDALNLLRIANSEPRAVVREPSYQHSSLLAEVDRLALTDERGDAPATLQKAVELLDEVPEIQRKQVTIISDFQRASWSPDSAGSTARLRQLMRTISDAAELILVDVGRTNLRSVSGTGNVALTSLNAQQPFVISGQPVQLEATVRNFGRTVLADQSVDLYVDGRLVDSRRIDFPPEGDARVEFSYTFETSGEHQLRVQIEDDSLPIDNRRWLALPVKNELNVLLVNGRRSGRASENATFYLETVFSPSTSKQKWRGFTRPRMIYDGELTTREDLSRFDCIFLCNVATFETREAEILQAYLEGGGGVVFCLGDQIRPENYNRVLFRDGEGILPGRLGERVGDADDPQQTFVFDAAELIHPIVRPFAGNPGTGLETSWTSEYVRVEPRSDAGVALRFSTGDPVIVDAPVGRGRSLIVTTSVETSWGPWPVQRSFPPIMHEIVHYAVTGRWEERHRLVGEPLTRIFPLRAFGVPVTVKRPDEVEEEARLTDEDGIARFSYRRTDRRGLYEVALGVPLSRSELFAVNLDSRESDLAKATEEELQTELFPGIEFTYLTEWREFRRRAESAATDRGSLTRWLLAAAFCLIIIEQMMAWKFYYGFLLLYVGVAVGFVQPVLQWSTGGGILVAVVLLAGFGLLVIVARRRAQSG